MMSNIKSDIVFIDDGPKQIEEVIQPIISKLWKEDIRSSMIMLGDFEKKENSLSEIDFEVQINLLKDAILKEFANFLIDQGCFNNRQVLEKYDLINKSYVFNESKIDASFDAKVDLICDKNGDNEATFDLWKSIKNDFYLFIDSSEKFNFEEFYKKYSVDSLAENLGISKFNIVLLDMCLLEGDINNLEVPIEKNNFVSNEKINKVVFPILSMGLYYALNKADYKIVMYTSYDFTNEMVEAWAKTYNLIFGDKKIGFYNRLGNRIYGNGKDKIIDEIKEKIEQIKSKQEEQ